MNSEIACVRDNGESLSWIHICIQFSVEWKLWNRCGKIVNVDAFKTTAVILSFGFLQYYYTVLEQTITHTMKNTFLSYTFRICVKM